MISYVSDKKKKTKEIKTQQEKNVSNLSDTKQTENVRRYIVIERK